jgi:hypothetical protein
MTRTTKIATASQYGAVKDCVPPMTKITNGLHVWATSEGLFLDVAEPMVLDADAQARLRRVLADQVEGRSATVAI